MSDIDQRPLFNADGSPADTPFLGPKSPRQERVLAALMTGAPLTNAHVRRIAGAANGPDVVAKLRARGLSAANELITEFVDVTDVDGEVARIGRWRLTDRGQAKVAAWKAGHQPREAA
ncbi:hypothetical protein [Roseateles sp.]|uniref:hypothetical protein n=1 Tax=Roseateles sp. TaxID=1971397 RepID=UPI0031DBFB46